MRRRQALRLLAAAAAGLVARPRRVLALGERSKLVLARLRLPGLDPSARPGALERLAWELSLRTSVAPRFEVPEPALDSPALFDSPFLYLWGASGFPPLSPAALGQLRRFLDFGGTLLCDDGSGHAGSDFERSVRREALRLYPSGSLARLPEDHSVFRSYYLMRAVSGRTLVSPFLDGVTIEDRSPLLLSHNDLGGAWARDRAGRWLYECVPGGEGQRQQALQLGVNIVLYALTVNYKQDQIHLPFILERMRR